MPVLWPALSCLLLCLKATLELRLLLAFPLIFLIGSQQEVARRSSLNNHDPCLTMTMESARIAFAKWWGYVMSHFTIASLSSGNSGPSYHCYVRTTCTSVLILLIRVVGIWRACHWTRAKPTTSAKYICKSTAATHRWLEWKPYWPNRFYVVCYSAWFFFSLYSFTILIRSISKS